MKKNTLTFIAIFITAFCFSQKVVIVGMNHLSSDGFSFVATENIPAGEIIYFTDNEYNLAGNSFTTGEAVVKYTVGSGGLSKGVVVFVNESSTNVFVTTCTSGDCGTAIISTNFGNGSFALATNGEGLYAYSDTDEDVANGVTEIYSVLFTGSGALPIQNGGTIPAIENPVTDFPNALVIDGFSDDGDGFVGLDRVEYMFDPTSSRNAVTSSKFQDVANWLTLGPNVGLSVVEFTNLNLAGDFVWNGAINSDWANSGNWDDNNAPGLLPSKNTTIPTGLTNYPVLTSGQDLSLANGLSLTIQTGASLNINPTVVINNNGTVIVDGSMTLQSDASGSAYIGSGTGVFNGDVTVERFIPARRAYRQLSSPVTTSAFITNNWQQATHITGSVSGANGFDATGSGNPSMYIFDNIAYDYFPVANTDATNLITGQGYHMLVRGDRTIDLSNNNATPIETTLSATGVLVAENNGSSTVTVNVPVQRFIFVGNPFQAPVNMNTVLTTGVSNINPAFYWVWDPTLGTRGAYATIVAATGTATAGAANQYLQAGQAGWVYTAGAGSASLNFTQASKNTSLPETAVFKTAAKKAASTGQLRLSLYESSALAANQSAADGVLVLFDDNGNNAVDGSDAPKFTNLDETFATSNNGTLLGIESRATAVETDIIPLEINTYRNTNYTIVLEGTGLSGATPLLFDTFTNSSTEIPASGNVNYAFSVNTNVSASIAADRFKILHTAKSLSVVEMNLQGIQMYPNPTNTGSFYLNIPQNVSDVEMSIYNALGAKVWHKTGFLSGNKTAIKTNSISSGLYFVKLTSEGKSITKKLIIN